jgi:hypothetical protein
MKGKIIFEGDDFKKKEIFEEILICTGYQGDVSKVQSLGFDPVTGKYTVITLEG